jgi:6-phosphogluconolactonase (cycloisomerase 2 family)
MLALTIKKIRELRVFLRMLANMIVAVGLVVVLASCSSSPGYSYTIGGTVSGMVGSGMVLQNNGRDDLDISYNGSFTFQTSLNAGTAYTVRVKTQPINPSQTCTVSNGSGTMHDDSVDNVVVNCVTGPTSVTVDPSSKYAYAANTNGTVSAYNIDQITGALTDLGTPVYAGTYPTSVTVDPSGKFAYAADTISGTIYSYTIDQTTGALGVGTAMPAGKYPTSVTVDKSGRFVYVANVGDNTISAYTIKGDGTLLELADSPFPASPGPASIITVQLSMSEFAYVANISANTISAYTIDQITGALTALGTPVSAGSYPSCVTVDPLGKFAYVANEGSSNISIYTINQATGALVPTGKVVAAGNSPTSIVTVLVGSSEFAYATNSGDGTIWFCSINLSDGNLSRFGQVFTGVYPSSIAVDPLERFAYVSNMGGGNISVYTINQTTGALE